MLEIISIYIAVAFSAAVAGFCLGTCFVPNEKLDIIKANKQTANDMASKAAAEKAAAELKLNADKIRYDAMNKPISVWIKFNVLSKANIAWNCIDNFFGLHIGIYKQEGMKLDKCDNTFIVKISYIILKEDAPLIDFSKIVPCAYEIQLN